MNTRRRTITAGSGLLALLVVISILVATVVLIAPALYALAQTMAALSAVLN
jgi:hypothetical protein